MYSTKNTKPDCQAGSEAALHRHRTKLRNPPDRRCPPASEEDCGKLCKAHSLRLTRE
jgi:hypothetical protein